LIVAFMPLHSVYKCKRFLNCVDLSRGCFWELLDPSKHFKNIKYEFMIFLIILIPKIWYFENQNISKKPDNIYIYIYIYLPLVEPVLDLVSFSRDREPPLSLDQDVRLNKIGNHVLRPLLYIYLSFSRRA
jgi:hypothetical protein